jgi:anti-sigma B factor antagonist
MATEEQRRDIADGTLRVSVTREDSLHLISLQGELDLANAETLEAELEAAMAGTADVVVDMRKLEFIDSTGIALLVGAMSRDGDSPRLGFVPSEFAAVSRVLELTGVAERMQPVDGRGPSVDGLRTA